MHSIMRTSPPPYRIPTAPTILHYAPILDGTRLRAMPEWQMNLEEDFEFPMFPCQNRFIERLRRFSGEESLYEMCIYCCSPPFISNILSSSTECSTPVAAAYAIEYYVSHLIPAGPRYGEIRKADKDQRDGYLQARGYLGRTGGQFGPTRQLITLNTGTRSIVQSTRSLKRKDARCIYCIGNAKGLLGG